MAKLSKLVENAQKKQREQANAASSKVVDTNLSKLNAVENLWNRGSTGTRFEKVEIPTLTQSEYNVEVDRLQKIRQQATVDLDTATVNDIDKRLKALREQQGLTTFGDRANDVTTAISAGVFSGIANTIGTGANVANDPEYYQRSINRLQTALETGKTTDGKVLNETQRKTVEDSIAELTRKKNRAESRHSMHNKIYKVADQASEDSVLAHLNAKKDLGKVGSTIVDASVAFGQSATAGIIGGLTGTGMAPFIVQAFGSAAQDARKNGGTLSDQLMAGSTQAAKEYVTEKLFGLALPQQLAGSKGSADEWVKKRIQNVAGKLANSENGEMVIGGLLTWLAGGATEALEEGIGALIENKVISPYFNNYSVDERTKEEKWEEALYDMLIGGVSGLFGVTNILNYTPGVKDAKVSPAAAPEVQQVQQQAAVVQEQNPESTVLDAATTMFTQQGMNLKTAQTRAEIVGKLIAGETVSDKDLNRIDPTSKQTKEIFTQLTGVVFPEGKVQIEELRNLYRSAHTVAQETQAQQAQTMEAQAQERAKTIQEQMDESGYKVSPETQTRIDEANAHLASQVANIDVGPDGKPLANLSTFAERYRAQVNKDASDADIKKAYTDFRNGSRTILFSGKRLTRNQFVQLFKDHGKNFSDKELDSMFNRAILDTLDGKDAYDRYTQKSESGKDSDTLKLSNGGVITRKQYRAFLKELGAKSNKTVTDAHANRLFDQQKALEAQGKTQPYFQEMDKFIKEDSNGRTDRSEKAGDSERDVQYGGAGNQTGRTESDDRGGQSGAEGDAGESGEGEKQVHGREKQARLQGRKVQPLGLSGLKNPRTSKVKVPGIFGKVQAVDKGDYTATMKAADEFVSSIGYKLIVTTSDFRTSLLEGFDPCDGLHDSENKIITVSAKESDSSDFYTAFMHEMFHVYTDKKNFQSKFMDKVCDEAKFPGATNHSEVYKFILNEALNNEYLSDYKRDFVRWGYTEEEIKFNILDEMFAEIRAGSNANLALDEAVFDELESAAYIAWKEVSPAYTKALQHGVVRDKLKEENANGRREDLLNEGVHGRDSERAGKPTGSVQQEKRGTEASNGRGMEARNSSAGEVRVGKDEEVQRVGSGAVQKRGRGQKEAKALNIAPKKAEIPTFKSWNDAFLYFEHGAGESTGLSFAEPPAFADEMSVGMGKPWKEIKTYPKTEAGLKEFQSEVDNLLNGEVETETTTETTNDVPDFVGKSHIDSFAKKKKNAKKVTIDGHEYDAVSLRDYTGAMRLIRRQAKDAGFNIEFVFGGIKSEGHEDALGLTIPAKRQIIVNVYDVEYLKTARHEMFHAYTYINPALHKRILDRVDEAGLSDVFLELFDKFAEDWSSYNDANINEWQLKFAIENEIFAEAFAKSTAHSEQVRKFIDIVRDEVDPWLDTWNPTEKELTKKLGYPDFDTLVDWYGEELNGFSIEDLSDEYMDFDMAYRVSPPAGDALSEYLKLVEETYGDELAQDMFDAFETMDLSRRVAEAMANMEESVGAAPIGFDPHSHMMNEYGTLEPGENPSRDIDIAASTNGKDKVSLNVRTVAEAKATPESRLESIEDAVVDGKLSYIPIKNKVKARQASYELRAKGWDDALADWTAAVRSGQRSPELVAMGATLLNNAGNNPKCTGKQYINILTDYTELVHGTAQALQATRILKKLTPSGRLYGIERLTQNMNEARGIKPEDNVPVEEWMERTGELLAERLATAVGGSKSKAKTTAQIILKDLNAFARESFPAKEKATPRTEQERLKDLFDNYDQYNEAWNAAKDTIREKYADKPEALAAFENWLEADLASSFLGRMLNAPEVHVNSTLADAYIHAETEEKRDAALDAILQDIANQIPSTLMEKFTALRYLNMLGNFKTVIRNVVGNAAFIPARKMKDAIGAIVEGSLASMGKEVERTKSFTRDKATYLACKDDFEVVRDIILSGGKYNDATKYSNAIEEKRRIFKSKFFEGYRTATKWAMDNNIFGDAGFSKIAYADTMARYLNANGATFESANEELLDKARAYAIQQAAEATYRDHNAFSDAIANMRFRNPQNLVEKGINTIGAGVLPFRRTPANILVRALEYSPVGFLTTTAEAIYGKQKGEYSATKLIDSLSKNATGSIIFMVGALALCEGLLKGKEPEEDKLANYEELLGHQFYAIELPNGMSLTLDWLAPSSIPLFLGAQFAEAAMRDGFSVRDIFEAATGVTDPLLQMSMLQGVNDALENASTYGDDGALVRFTGNALWSFMTQGLTNTFLGQVERALSNQRSTTYADKNKDVPDGLQRLLGKTSAKIPGVDYNQIPYIDAWGRTEKNARTAAGNVLNQFFNPAYTSWVKESKMEKELRRLYEATGTAGVLPGRAKSYFNVDKKRLDLTAEQYVQYATTKGQTSYAVLADLTSGAQYKSMPDAIKEKAVVKAFDFANELAKAEVTGYTPDKWDKDPKEGQYAPEKWVMEAVENADKYGFSVSDYVAVSTQLNEIESIKNSDGDTVSGSVSVQKAIAILELGLNDKQTKKLMEDFDVGEDYRKLTMKALKKKLSNMEKKAQK